jgi:protein-tyrosine-phosphatase
VSCGIRSADEGSLRLRRERGPLADRTGPLRTARRRGAVCGLHSGWRELHEDVEWADLVVTMGCGDACPVLPGKEYVDWNLPDPAGLCLEEVRELREVIEQRVASLPL